ncbi:hypothetical protein ACHAWF_016107 [Thalassiosira exigua]
MALFEADDDPSTSFPTEPAFLVPVEVREVPRLGPGQRGVFALEAIPAKTKFWAWTDRVKAIHRSDLEEHIARTFGGTGGGDSDAEAARIFLRQGFVLPRLPGPSEEAGEEEEGAGADDRRPDDYFYTNPTDAGRFMNHSEEPNCGPDGTLRDVRAGEELTMDYCFHGEPGWYREICAKYGVLTEAQVAARCKEST